MQRKHLGALDIGRFMKRHWQREPLMVRGAFPDFRDPLCVREVLALAGSDEASSRLVRRSGKKWSLQHGPIARVAFERLPARDWTVLVQDTNHFAARADTLLRCFDFIPHARIDDVMVSYAVPGGGVGAHVDSYDVFLLQGHGRRRWQISRQLDHSFVPGLPLKVLRSFEPEQEWVLEAGDMLYLPPGVAHHGVAETECLTWSIGFRAPTNAEVVQGFLDHLRDELAPPGQYRDPGAAPARHAGEIPPALTAHIAAALRSIRWGDGDAREFAGRFLTEPKSHVFFEPPARPLARAAFARRMERAGIALDPRSRLAFSGTIFFINGERAEVPAQARALLRKLADERTLPAPPAAPQGFVDTMHAWYLQGFAVFPPEER